MAAVFDRAHEIVPNDVDTKVCARIGRSAMACRYSAVARVIDTVLAENPCHRTDARRHLVDSCLVRHDFRTASRALAAVGNNPYQDDAINLSPAFVRGLVARAQGDGIAANAAFSEARTRQEKLVQRAA